jgi:hypothetical protein
MSRDKQTFGEELSDMFYALQITTKIMEGITKEHDEGSRSQDDFESRWHGQSELLCRNLAKIKPLVEKFISKGYSKYVSSVSPDTAQQIQSCPSDGICDQAQFQIEESGSH